MLNIIQKIKSFKKCKRRQARRKIVIASLFTGSVTALLTFFTSKKTGEQNRKMVAVKSQNIFQKAKKFAGETNSKIQNTASEVARNAKEIGSKTVHKVEEFSDDIRQKAMSVRENVNEKFHNSVADNAGKVANTVNRVENAAKDVEIREKSK